jgi:hypothetical protein
MHRCVSFSGLALAVLVASAGSASAQGHAHQHGRVTLEVAVDVQAITVRLDAPLHDLLGFERAPRSVAERGRVTAMAAQLQAADKWFALDAAGGCKLAKVQLVSPVLGLPEPTAPATTQDAASEHADLALTAEFVCDKSAAARHADVKLFDAFAGVRTVEAQVATAKGQSSSRLRKGRNRLTLASSAP